MPRKRKSGKARNVTVTPELVTAYKRAKELEAVYRGCNKREPECSAPSPSVFCESCTEYLDASCLVHQLADEKLWGPSVLQVDGPEPADWCRDDLRSDLWIAAWSLKQDLEKELRNGR